MTYLLICEDKDVVSLYSEGRTNMRHPDGWLCLVHRLAFSAYEDVHLHLELIREGKERRHGILSLEEVVNKEVADDNEA